LPKLLISGVLVGQEICPSSVLFLCTHESESIGLPANVPFAPSSKLRPSECGRSSSNRKRSHTVSIGGCDERGMTKVDNKDTSFQSHISK
jgi:hypothetical protein